MKHVFPLMHGASGAFDLMAIAGSGISPRLLAHASERDRREQPESAPSRDHPGVPNVLARRQD